MAVGVHRAVSYGDRVPSVRAPGATAAAAVAGANPAGLSPVDVVVAVVPATSRPVTNGGQPSSYFALRERTVTQRWRDIRRSCVTPTPRSSSFLFSCFFFKRTRLSLSLSKRFHQWGGSIGVPCLRLSLGTGHIYFTDCDWMLGCWSIFFLLVPY